MIKRRVQTIIPKIAWVLIVKGSANSFAGPEAKKAIKGINIMSPITNIHSQYFKNNELTVLTTILVA